MGWLRSGPGLAGRVSASFQTVTLTLLLQSAGLRLGDFP